MGELIGKTPEDPSKGSFGDNLRFYRERADLTPADLGRFMGVDPSLVAGWEAGETPIRKKDLQAIGDVFNLPIEQLQEMLGIDKYLGLPSRESLQREQERKVRILQKLRTTGVLDAVLEVVGQPFIPVDSGIRSIDKLESVDLVTGRSLTPEECESIPRFNNKTKKWSATIGTPINNPEDPNLDIAFLGVEEIQGSIEVPKSKSFVRIRYKSQTGGLVVIGAEQTFSGSDFSSVDGKEVLNQGLEKAFSNPLQLPY